jgi:hypothetical protein
VGRVQAGDVHDEEEGGAGGLQVGERVNGAWVTRGRGVLSQWQVPL